MPVIDPAILAIIPAYNESRHIAGVVQRTRIFLPVLVVDDGSSDLTSTTAQAAGARVFRQDPNQGKGAALRAGFRLALEQDYQAVVTLDADGQHDPAEIPAFLECYRETQADLVIGKRDFQQMPLVRRLSNTSGRWLFSWAIGADIPDNQSGYRLLSRRMLLELLDSREGGFEFEVEMIRVCLRHAYRLEWVPISTIYAGEASHISPIKHLVNFLRLVWRTRRNR